jgi:hypothetical protein
METLGGFPNLPATGFAQQLRLAQQLGELPNNSRRGASLWVDVYLERFKIAV